MPADNDTPEIDDKALAVWNCAVDTLSSMCISEKLGNGPTKGAFILTLRLYADKMEELIKPNQP